MVDNNSFDDTKAIARRYTKKVYDKGPESSAQRNYGMLEKSKGACVMFADEDMIFGPFLVRACVSYLNETKAAALHILEIALDKIFFSRMRRFERGFYDGTVVEGARFFTRAAFRVVRGFDESTSVPEDWHIDKKIKRIGKITLLPSSPAAPEAQWHVAFDGYLHERGVDPARHGNAIFHN